MAMAAPRASLVLSDLDPPSTPVEPTFYLEGQPYLFNHAECLLAGPDFARLAILQTWRRIWYQYAEFTSGRVPEAEFRQEVMDLMFGAMALRDLIEGDEVLVPQGHFTVQH